MRRREESAPEPERCKRGKKEKDGSERRGEIARALPHMFSSRMCVARLLSHVRTIHETALCMCTYTYDSPLLPRARSPRARVSASYYRSPTFRYARARAPPARLLTCVASYARAEITIRTRPAREASVYLSSLARQHLGEATTGHVCRTPADRRDTHACTHACTGKHGISGHVHAGGTWSETGDLAFASELIFSRPRRDVRISLAFKKTR